MTDRSAPIKPEQPSLILPEALASRLGHDLVLQWLTRAGHPLTVETYVTTNWPDGLPDEPDQEDVVFLEALRKYEATTPSAT